MGATCNAALDRASWYTYRLWFSYRIRTLIPCSSCEKGKKNTTNRVNSGFVKWQKSYKVMFLSLRSKGIRVITLKVVVHTVAGMLKPRPIGFWKKRENYENAAIGVIDGKRGIYWVVGRWNWMSHLDVRFYGIWWVGISIHSTKTRRVELPHLWYLLFILGNESLLANRVIN